VSRKTSKKFDYNFLTAARQKEMEMKKWILGLALAMASMAASADRIVTVSGVIDRDWVSHTQFTPNVDIAHPDVPVEFIYLATDASLQPLQLLSVNIPSDLWSPSLTWTPATSGTQGGVVGAAVFGLPNGGAGLVDNAAINDYSLAFDFSQFIFLYSRAGDITTFQGAGIATVVTVPVNSGNVPIAPSHALLIGGLALLGLGRLRKLR
jgi:hypothetical protein